ncbi:MAG: hypothetical protein CMF62_03385 [Magnetococcales bacterium]|nr:hypothetical protein [Magnetococcales bacterium]
MQDISKNKIYLSLVINQIIQQIPKHSFSVLDWDDTLFPTSWIHKKQIDLNNKNIRKQNIPFFVELDDILFKFLIKLLNMSKVVIVTNARMKWIKKTSELIPNTSDLINNYIEIISARDLHEKQFPNNSHKWKELVFRDIINIRLSNSKNIISVGDGNSEYLALNKLYELPNFFTEYRILKAIKLKKNQHIVYLLIKLN